MPPKIHQAAASRKALKAQGDNQGQRVHHAANCQHRVGDRRCLRHPAAERTAGRGKGICSCLRRTGGIWLPRRLPAFRTPGKARGASSWLGLEPAGKLAAPAVYFVAPSNGKWHVVSLVLGKICLSIIAGIARGREVRSHAFGNRSRARSDFAGGPGGTTYRSPPRKCWENARAKVSPLRVCVRARIWFT